MIENSLYSIYQLYLFKNFNEIDLSISVIKKFENRLNLFFLPQEKENNVCYAYFPNLRIDYKDFYTPSDIINYIFAFAHSPGVRDIYKPGTKKKLELSVPIDTKSFWKLAEIGKSIKKNLYFADLKNTTHTIQLIRTASKKNISKNNSIKWEFTDKERTLGRIWINSEEYFDNIPFIIWDFSIYGFKPVQRWIIQRNKILLVSELISHFQKIINSIGKIHRILVKNDSTFSFSF